MQRKPSPDTLAVVVLLTIFLCTAATLLLFGLQVYQDTGNQMEETFEIHTPLSYLASRSRQHDGVHVSAFDDGTPALLMESEYGGELYYTWLYYYNNGLYELFTPADVVLTPPDGELLIETRPLSFSQDNGIITINYSDGGDSVNDRLLLVPRTPAQILTDRYTGEVAG